MVNSVDNLVAEHQHQPRGHCPHAVASTIIQRHRDNRQRFDSADYEMAQQSSGQCAACTCGKCSSSTGSDLEHEPEPGSIEQLRSLRLQRFDSADWALKAHKSSLADPSSLDAPHVAQMLLDRHAVKPCAYIGPPPVKSIQGHDTEPIKSIDEA